VANRVQRARISENGDFPARSSCSEVKSGMRSRSPGHQVTNAHFYIKRCTSNESGIRYPLFNRFASRSFQVSSINRVLRNLTTDTPQYSIRGSINYDKCGGNTPTRLAPGGGSLFSGETWQRTNPWYAAASAAAAAPGNQSRIGVTSNTASSTSQVPNNNNANYHPPTSTSNCVTSSNTSQKGMIKGVTNCI